MKAKNIMMSLLLVMGAIAAKASGYPPELALVSQPVMVYNYSSITVYYDVENIGDYTYRGYVSLYLDPDYGYSYAEKYVRVRPGHIKRVAIEIPTYKIHSGHRFTIMPYYELGDDLYSFTIFEYFEPINFYFDGPRNERWVVINVPPRPRVYHRPGDYRFYYDGYRPPMPPPGHGPGTPPPPMDPHHHTYGYHHSNGGYPATHNEFNDHPAPSATVRPNDNAGSMSSGGHNSGTNNNAPTPNSGGSSSRPKASSNSGRVNGSSSSGSRPSSSTGSSSSRVSSSSSSGSSTARPSNSSSSSGRVSGSSSSTRPSSANGSSSGRVNKSSSSRSSGTSGSSSTRTSSTSNTRSSGTSTSSSRSGNNSTRSSSSSSSSRSSGSATGSGRR